jgi:hypothetical protein
MTERGRIVLDRLMHADLGREASMPAQEGQDGA